MTQDISVRRAGRADLDPWLQMFDDAVEWLVTHEREGQWGTEPLSTQPRFAARVAGWIENGDGRVATVGDRPVGAAAFTTHGPAYAPPADAPEIYVEALVVERAHAGRGVGRHLLETAVAEARALGYQQVRLDCWAGGDQALVRYYESCGFSRRGTLQVGTWQGQLLTRDVRDETLLRSVPADEEEVADERAAEHDEAVADDP